jgi:subtilase family serine protease
LEPRDCPSGPPWDLGTANALYGRYQTPLDGAGVTVAVVVYGECPGTYADLHQYDQIVGLPDPAVSVIDASAGDADPTGEWQVEADLDVQAIHVMAPRAAILLVEVASPSLDYLMGGAWRAGTLAQVVNLSFDAEDWAGTFDARYDPELHLNGGTCYVAAAGDVAGAGSPYPAESYDALAVGGTQIAQTPVGPYESAWHYSDGFHGTETVEGHLGVAAWQRPYTPHPYRAGPDVAYLADRAEIIVGGALKVVSGTSLSAPCWASIVALADEARLAAGQPPLGSQDAERAVYAMDASRFHDVTQGLSAGPGFDDSTGRGSPVIPLVVQDLAGYAAPLQVAAAMLYNALTRGGAT